MFTRNLTLALACAVIGRPIAYAPGEPGWKKDADGKLVVDGDGNPIYIDSAGAEKSLASDTVSRLNGEARTNRERAEAAETALQKYGDFKPEHVKDAKVALETVKNIKDGDLIKAGEAERVREEIKRTYEQQISEKDQRVSTLEGSLTSLRLENAFNGSQFIKDQIAIPPALLKDSFGKYFKIENDQIVAYDDKGQKMIAPKRGGEYATFDEAIQSLVEASPYKDNILKSSGGTGSGGNGNGGQRGGGRVIRRAEFDKMSPVEMADIAAKQRAGEVTIAD